MFRKVQVGKYTEYECNFGKKTKNGFLTLCTVRSAEDQYQDAYDVFLSTNGDSPLTLYRASLILFDRAVLNYVDAYLYQPETDDFIKFTPNMWKSEDLLDYGVFVGERFYVHDATVQINKTGSIYATQNPTGGLQDEESNLVLTGFHIFVEYL